LDVCFVAAGAGCSRKCGDVGTGHLPIGPAKTQRFEMWLTEGCESVLWGRMPLSFTQEGGDAEQAEDCAWSGARGAESVQAGRWACSSGARMC
jgi:hypothetical protein